MIHNIYDKTSKISFSVYGNDFLQYFGEYKKVISELGTELDTLYGKHKRLDKLVLVDDGTLQNWEFEFGIIGENELVKSWGYNVLKAAQTGKIVDSFIISFGDPEKSEEVVEIGRSIVFAPIVKYLQKMGLPKRLNNLEEKVKNNIRISKWDELTLIFVTLSVPDNDKEEMVKRVCRVLEKIDYINAYRRTVIDSLISFQIENFVKSKNDREKLNEVVDMQVPVDELFLQVEREARYDEGYDVGFDEGKAKGFDEGKAKGFDEGKAKGFDEGKAKGFDEGKDEIILKMLAKSVSLEVIQEFSGCSLKHILELKNNHFASK